MKQYNFVNDRKGYVLMSEADYIKYVQLGTYWLIGMDLDIYISLIDPEWPVE